MDASVSTQHHTLEPYDAKRLATLCGQLNEHLHSIAHALEIDIANRGNLFQLTGEPKAIKLGNSILQHLYELTSTRHELSKKQVQATIEDYLTAGKLSSASQASHNAIITARPSPLSSTRTISTISNPLVSHPASSASPTAPAHKRGHKTNTALDTSLLKVQPRGKNQLTYIENIYRHDINFGIGPAGTGKTYLAVACAIAALEIGSVSRIILARPAVEAGEKLGFLPGDAAEKVDPYLKPLYDALHDMMGIDQVKRLIAKEVIEIAPLAYMRGRTLNQAFIILDESQNTTAKQMKMFLTRLGFDSKAVITGDPTQIDLPKGVESGITNAIQVLSGIEGIAFNYFDQSDIVRHSLVKKIVVAYDHYENNTLAPNRLLDTVRLTAKNKASKARLTI